MRSLLNTLRRLPEFEDLLLRIDAGRCPVAASGLSPVHRAVVAAGIALRAERPVVLLCADEVDAARLSKDVSALLEQPVMQLPAREFTFHTAATASHQWEQRRLAVLQAMADGAAPVVAAIAAAVQAFGGGAYTLRSVEKAPEAVAAAPAAPVQGRRAWARAALAESTRPF